MIKSAFFLGFPLLFVLGLQPVFSQGLRDSYLQKNQESLNRRAALIEQLVAPLRSALPLCRKPWYSAPYGYRYIYVCKLKGDSAGFVIYDEEMNPHINEFTDYYYNSTWEKTPVHVRVLGFNNGFRAILSGGRNLTWECNYTDKDICYVQNSDSASAVRWSYMYISLSELIEKIEYEAGKRKRDE